MPTVPTDADAYARMYATTDSTQPTADRHATVLTAIQAHAIRAGVHPTSVLERWTVQHPIPWAPDTQVADGPAVPAELDRTVARIFDLYDVDYEDDDTDVATVAVTDLLAAAHQAAVAARVDPDQLIAGWAAEHAATR